MAEFVVFLAVVMSLIVLAGLGLRKLVGDVRRSLLGRSTSRGGIDYSRSKWDEWEAAWNDEHAEELLRIFLLTDSLELTARLVRAAQSEWAVYDWWRLLERLAGDTGTTFSWRMVLDEMKHQVEDESGHPIEWTR